MDEWERKRLEATVQTAAICAYVDGHLATEEREKLCECIAVHAKDEKEARQLLALVGQLPEWSRKPQAKYRDTQFEEIKSALRTKAERECAFLLAVQVADSHRGMGDGETSFLLDLMRELEIEAGYARNLLNRARANHPTSASNQKARANKL